jgi:Cu2+-exporting ATPase
MDSVTLRLQVPDIRCAGCALKIEDSIRDLAGINRCRTNVASKQVIVEHDPAALSGELIQEHIRSLGFAEVNAAQAEDIAIRDEAKTLLARLGVAGIGAMQVMMFALVSYVAGEGGVEPAYIKLMQWASFAIATPVALFSAVPFYRNAINDLKHRRVGMDVPVSLAILSAYSLSSAHMLGQGEVYFDSVCMFTFLLLMGRFLELRSRQRYQDNITLADRCLPEMANLSGGAAVPVNELKVGQLVRVSAGEIIPVDGVVTEGRGQVSESAFTGESTAYSKTTGSNVLAGSELLDGEIEIQSSADTDDSVLAGMSKLYQDAMLYKPGFALLADTVSRYFVMAILGMAALSGGVWFMLGNPEWFVILITVLVVSCPCALSLATPIAYTVAVTSLKQRGVVVRAGSFLEKLAEVDHVIFDKTGTLTEGQLNLEQVNILDDNWTESSVIEICAALEYGSKHPIAQAFHNAAAGKEVASKAANLESIVGEGVQGTIDGVSYRLGKPDLDPEQIQQTGAGTWVQLSASEPIALICLTDEIRDSSIELFKHLPGHLKTTLLSGDRNPEVTRIASLLGIQTAMGEQTPEGKLAYIRQCQQAGESVLMVGDGFNDAAAMAAADAAIAVSPVDILLQEAADASLLRQDITRISELLQFAARLKRIVRQNITWAVAYNFSVIPLAVTGFLEPWMAALGMSLSSLAVVANAGRLQKMGKH